MDSLISTFHIDWHLIVAQAVNFVIVLLVLYFFALKPLKKLMEERGATIAGGLDNAKKQAELLANAEVEYKNMIAKADAESAAKAKEAKKNLETQRTETLAKIQAEGAALIEASKKQIASDKAKMLEEVKSEITATVIAVAEKVLGSTVTEKVETKLVEESMKGIK